MQQRMLHLSCIHRDAALSSWFEGETVAHLHAYRVFETENGYGVAGQTVDHDRKTDTWQRVIEPARIIDGLTTEGIAIAWMRACAASKLEQLTQHYQEQGETVLVAAVEVGP